MAVEIIPKLWLGKKCEFGDLNNWCSGSGSSDLIGVGFFPEISKTIKFQFVAL